MGSTELPRAELSFLADCDLRERVNRISRYVEYHE